MLVHADHWLYDVIPRSRAEAKWWQVPLWALFGNDEDGLFGEPYTDGWYKNAGFKPSLGLAIRWWLRNPFHNFKTHTMAWPVESSFWLYRSVDGKPGEWQTRYPQTRWIANREREFGIAVWPPYVVFRNSKLEGYFGWGPRGTFGIALRAAHATDANYL